MGIRSRGRQAPHGIPQTGGALMDTTLYLDHWTPDDEQFGITQPKISVSGSEDNEPQFWLRFEAGHRYVRSKVTMTMDADQLRDLRDQIDACLAQDPRP